MTIQIVDLSVPLESFPAEHHDAMVTYWGHADGARRLARNGGFDPEQLPRSCCAGSCEEMSGSTHAGTHIDAPWHFGPTVNGARSKTIDEMPLEWCFGDGVVLDFSAKKKDGDTILVPEVEAALKEIGYSVKAGDIVLFRTGADDHWGKPDYGAKGAGLTPEVVHWFFRQGVRVLTTDAYSLDVPIHLMFEKLKAGDTASYFPVHRAGRDVEYTHAEKVVNLRSLPPYGFKVALFPIKISRASGAWIRAVAIFDEALQRTPHRLVDLSTPLQNFTADDEPVNVTYWDHYDFARRAAKHNGVDPAKFPVPNVGAAMDAIVASSRAATHILAPWFFAPERQGRPALTVDKVPLQWCYGPAVILDISDLAAGARVTTEIVQDRLQRISHRLAPGDIILLYTGDGAKWGQPAYRETGARLTRDALIWLVGQGVKVVGTDAATLDEPLLTAAEKLRNGKGDGAFELFEAAATVEFVGAAKLTNLHLLPSTGAKIALFPVKLRKAGAAWCRAVGMLPSAN